MTKRTLLSAFMLFFLVLPRPVVADQADPRLDALFQELEQDLSRMRAERVQNMIWSIWSESDDQKVNRLMEKGVSVMTMGGYRQALDIFTEVTEIAPNFAEGWNKRATVFYLVDQYKKSLADVEQTLLLEPRHFGAIAGLGLNFEALGRKREARDAYAEALKVNPHMPRIRERLKILQEELADDPV